MKKINGDERRREKMMVMTKMKVQKDELKDCKCSAHLPSLYLCRRCRTFWRIYLVLNMKYRS